jgi:aspartyl-tRNA(Asn)/glutamyl-tRNA(Gln) amidotransferase subunit A
VTPTIQGAARAIAARTLSLVELTQRLLARIRAQDGTLHAFTEVAQARALSDARATEARAMAGTLRGPLDGIPIAHKDIFATVGIATTGCSRQLAGWLPRGDAAAVAGLAAAGTVLLGKLASPATRRAVDKAVQVFRGLGAEVREASLPVLADFEACG